MRVLTCINKKGGLQRPPFYIYNVVEDYSTMNFWTWLPLVLFRWRK